MEKTFKGQLIENALLYLGMALMVAAVIFWGLLHVLITYRKHQLTEDWLLILELTQDIGTVFIFALGVAIAFAGFMYAAVRAWQAFQSPSHKDKHP
ncbi:hypothetical protein [Providencia sp. PROV120]|uniref:hypothetical protein n=1 Tax=Providencia sp. PROV120 TaxID=2949831 RepID=UPI0023494270|nr:hypothetical protein [Providencia sp. PROV120]